MGKIIGATVGTSMNPKKVVEQTAIEERVDKLSEDVKNLKANEISKAELVTEVLNALPTWQGGAY